MPRFVVLLRGVNVGKGKRVPMAQFKALLQGLGHADVHTLLNSGNAVFTGAARPPARHAADIAQALQQGLGVDTLVIVKTAAQWAAIIQANPMPPAEPDHARHLVAVGADAATLAGLAPLQALAVPPERFVVTHDAAYLHAPHGVLQSKLATALLGKAGQGVTTRNWATVLKLAQRLGPGDAAAAAP